MKILVEETRRPVEQFLLVTPKDSGTVVIELYKNKYDERELVGSITLSKNDLQNLVRIL